MAIVRPFAAVRSTAEYAKSVAALPYDVMNRDEAAKMAHNNPLSFLHISRAEIDLPEAEDPHGKAVYLKAGENFRSFLDKGVLIREEKACYYIYRQKFQGRTQTGLVATFSIDDYENNIIKKHELTLHEKEKDRTDHFDACSAHTEPVFLAYQREDRIQTILQHWTLEHEVLFDFTTGDQVSHELWIIDDENEIKALEDLFAKVADLYIADGHHRSASAVRVGLNRRKEAGNYTGKEEFNFFPGVIFPHDELKIYDYNRLVRDLNGLKKDEFFQGLAKHFSVIEIGNTMVAPVGPRYFSMYMDSSWYSLKLQKEDFSPENPVDDLDVSILQNLVLGPILGISDPRTDKRIEFSGGIRGLAELKKRVDEGMALAFALYPPSMEDLLKISQMGLIMPPKSTWFEPKLASGLFVHEF